MRIAIAVLTSCGLLLVVIAPSIVLASQPSVGSDGSSPTTTVLAPADSPTGQQGANVRPRRAEAVTSPADDLEKLARSSFGDRFAGVSAEGGEFTVHVKADDNTATPATIGGRPVVVEKLSWSELDAAKVVLDTGYEGVERRGFVMASWGIDIGANALRIQVLTDGERLDEARAAIAEVVPGVPLIISPVEELATSTARHNDTAGWGAAKIVNTQTCTAGFGWENQYGTELMITAGHCSFTSPAIWMNGTGSAAYGWQIWNGLDGTAPWRNDIAAMTRLPGWTPYFYIGGPTNNGGVRVTSYYPGSQLGLGGIITSGAVTGEYTVAPGAVIAENLSVNFGGSDVRYGLTQGQCYAQAGDSGAPVYRVGTGGTILLMGILVGLVFGLPGAECLYTPTSVILAHHGGWPLY